MIEAVKRRGMGWDMGRGRKTRLWAILWLVLAGLALSVVLVQDVRAQTANESPAFAAATVTRSVSENVEAGTLVGLPVTATDADGDAVTYSLGGTDAAVFDIDAGSGQITVAAGAPLDYESKASYAVTVTATDPFGASASVAVTIEVEDLREAGDLGSLVFQVGSSGSTYGYSSGDYGSLQRGQFPGALFGDGNARTVDALYEDDGHWFLVYSGGAVQDWNADQEHLDEIVLTAEYADGRDTREFVLGGFIAERSGDYTLKLAPPLPGASRDWDGRAGGDVTFEFRRTVTQQATPSTQPLTDPAGTSGSLVEFVAETTPGGPITAQALITLLVYIAVVFRSPATVWGILVAAIALIVTPWVPVIFGFGDTIAASINLVNVPAGAYLYKVFAARTE